MTLSWRAIKMADWLSFFSALVIVGCFLILARFIGNLGIMEREAMFNLNLPRRDIPSQPMVGVENPFNLKLKAAISSSTADRGVIHFLLTTTAPCYVNFYWEVRRDAVDSILCNSDKQPRSNFDDDENSSSSDSDLEEVPTMSALPLEHFLQGFYKEQGESEFYDSGLDLEIVAVPPADLQYASSSSSSHTITSSHSVYSLIVTVEMCRNDELGPHQLSDIVALMTAVEVSRSSASKLTSNIVKQFVQTAEGNIYSMKKLFVVESDDITETQLTPSSESPSAQITSSSSAEHGSLPSISSELTNSVCIICRSLPVTRAFLPCRHVCVCGLCFQQLSYCPMCRAFIQSHFKVQDEPFIDNAESNNSNELQGMSVGDILRGVFSAS